MMTIIMTILALIGLTVLLPVIGSLLAALMPMFGSLLLIVISLMLLGAVIGRITGKK